MIESVWFQLSRYLLGQISLADFEDWFASASRNSHQIEDKPLRQLLGEIQLSLSEYSSGHRTEEELREQLTRIVPILFYQSPEASHAQTGTSTRVRTEEWRIQPVDIRPLTVSG